MNLTNNQKTGLLIGAFVLIVSTLLIILHFAFKRPNHHDEAKWGVVHINLDRSFDVYQREQFQEGVKELNRLGPTFSLDEIRGPNSIRVVNADLTSGDPGRCPIKGSARFVLAPGDSWIEIDPTCTQGNLQFRTAFMHEVGHALGMGHVCFDAVDHGTDCSFIGRGMAVMNPTLNPGGDGESFDSVPSFEIQELDVKEFERVYRPGAPLIRR